MYRSNDLKTKIESCAFHTAKDRVERFEAYNCRIELLERSKLIRAQVRQFISFPFDVLHYFLFFILTDLLI